MEIAWNWSETYKCCCNEIKQDESVTSVNCGMSHWYFCSTYADFSEEVFQESFYTG